MAHWRHYVFLFSLIALGRAHPVAATVNEVHPADWPALKSAVSVQADIEKSVQQLLNSLTLEEKVGQLIQADIDSIRPEDLAQYPLGSILAGGNAAPNRNVHSGADEWLNLTEAFFQASKQRASPNHPPIPVLFGIDAVHGHAKVRGATLFPHNVGLGATHDPGLIEKIGRATAEEVAATGIDWTFAPTVAVVRDIRWGRSYESYSEDPALVAVYAQAMVNGLQGKVGTADFLTPTHTLASAKHFLGDGGTIAGRDQFDNLADERTLRDVHGAGYVGALSAGDLIVMASYNGWHGTKMHANQQLLTDVLKQRWSFPGFVVGDWNAHEEIPGCTKWSCPAFLNAGGDMYMAPDSWKQLYANLIKQVNAGEISQARLDDAVTRILRVKMLAGLFSEPAPKDRVSAGQLPPPGSAAHRAIARQAVRESLVLLKNNKHTLPLDSNARILVAGVGANDIGMQSGGWTVDWQGNHNTNADFPGATSIQAGIEAALQAGGGKIVTRIEDNPAAAIVVYGEKPYAEFQGDRETLEFAAADGHLELLQRLRAAHIPVISLFISGRPLWVNREINLSDAFVAVWLPGSEGGGIADLLFKPHAGATAYDFTGRLSFSWPATAMPVTFEGSQVTGMQFARGYGLTFTESPDLADLPEDPRAAPRLQRPRQSVQRRTRDGPVVDLCVRPERRGSTHNAVPGLAGRRRDGAIIRAERSGNLVGTGARPLPHRWPRDPPDEGCGRQAGTQTALSHRPGTQQAGDSEHPLRAGRTLRDGTQYRAEPHRHLPERRHRHLEDPDPPPGLPEKAGRDAVLGHGAPGNRERGRVCGELR